ncbi:HNH endonuclease [Flavobacterium psychrophilum]|nr:HNH endonuclease [Flavobacterium psychrophilum]EKT4508359.1 HNH endonuclease [Flavobacterium psychrophilum]
MSRLQTKKGRPTNYRKSLKSNPYWDEVKAKVRLRDNFKCADCRSIIRLETHHITYYVNGKSIVGCELEHLDWLVTLCEDCHEKAHKIANNRFNPSNKNKVKHNG